MVYSTIIFLCVFLPIVITGYYLIPKQGKNVFLLLCSLFFYAWGEPKYVFVMLFSIVCNYFFGLCIANAEKNMKLCKLTLTLAVLLNLSLLGIFKYAGFVLVNVDKIMPNLIQVPEIALPIGISFYTFQGLSYCIDVYRDKKLVQKNPISLALYISLFPQLIAGPIVRYSDIKDSLKERNYSISQFSEGAERFIIGLSKKAILANATGQLASAIMGGNYATMSVLTAWVGAIAYALQIYFDFSGYSDMAIGLGKIFGFHFAENFNYPYISKSIREFWRRWHISLSTWFKDYLYIPLGGNKKGNVYVNLLIVFLATGIWHGAAWGFVIWGLWHGFFSIVERIISNYMKKKNIKIGGTRFNKGFGKLLINAFMHVYTMVVVIVGWVLFNLVSVRNTLAYLKVMFGLSKANYIDFDTSYYLGHRTLFLFVLAIIFSLPVSSWMKKAIPVDKEESTKYLYLVLDFVKKLILVGLLILSFIFIISSSYNPFIYFRF